MTKLIRDKDGYPIFPDTKADLRYVDKKIELNEAVETTSATFMQVAERMPEVAGRILDHYIKTIKVDKDAPLSV